MWCQGKRYVALDAEEARAFEKVKRYHKICRDLKAKLWLRK